MALVPLNLVVTHRGKSSRQHVTCRYKCGDECSKPVPNTSENEYFGDIARQAISRRSALRAGGITVLAVGPDPHWPHAPAAKHRRRCPPRPRPPTTAQHEIHLRRTQQ